VSRKHKAHDDHEEHPSEAWLIALADMMTLLMVTFLMMFAISNLDLKKFQTFKEAFSKGTGASLPSLPGEGVPTKGDVTDKLVAPKNSSTATVTNTISPNTGGKILDPKAMDELKKVVEKQLKKVGLADKVEAKIDPDRGLVLYVTSAVLFASGQADVTPEGAKLLDSLGPALKTVPNHLTVEGHTDSRPIRSTKFTSNWALSAMRATAVATRLMDDGHIPQQRFSIAGYGSTRPRQNLSTEAAYALNRRVEIVVEAPPAPKSTTTTTTDTETATKSGSDPAAAPSPSASEKSSEKPSEH
jgi:chemotaxis protein MotB